MKLILENAETGRSNYFRVDATEHSGEVSVWLTDYESHRLSVETAEKLLAALQQVIDHAKEASDDEDSAF